MALKTVKLLMVLIGLVVTLSIQTPGHAAENNAKSNGDKKKISVDFEDELVEGDMKKPELFYLLQKKQFNFKRLIKLRENFLPEMRRDADGIGRGRSKN